MKNNKFYKKLYEATERQNEIHSKTAQIKADKAGLQGLVNWKGIKQEKVDKHIEAIKASGGEGIGNEESETSSVPTTPNTDPTLFTRKATAHLMSQAVERKIELSAGQAQQIANRLYRQHLEDPTRHREFVPAPGETAPSNVNALGDLIAKITKDEGKKLPPTPAVTSVSKQIDVKVNTAGMTPKKAKPLSSPPADIS